MCISYFFISRVHTLLIVIHNWHKIITSFFSLIFQLSSSLNFLFLFWINNKLIMNKIWRYSINAFNIFHSALKTYEYNLMCLIVCYIISWDDNLPFLIYKYEISNYISCTSFNILICYIMSRQIGIVIYQNY